MVLLRLGCFEMIIHEIKTTRNIETRCFATHTGRESSHNKAEVVFE
jgi:hypothetical protein